MGVVTSGTVPWAGKVAVVTGAASGIGEATALAFAREGASVVLVDMAPAALADVLGNIKSNGGRAMTATADVTSESAVRELAEKAVATFGRVDVLANVAGIMLRHDRIEDWSLEDFRRVVDVDLTSLFITTKAFAPAMANSGGGAVVNISSLAALVPVPYSPCYAAAKAGVLAMTRTLAVLLAPQRIRLNAILPTLVDTPMIRAAPSRGQVPTLSPSDIARTVLYVAADASLNGVFLRVDRTVSGPRVSIVKDPPESLELSEQPF